MNKKLNQQLIDNISQLLKRSLVADAALEQLRAEKKAGFSAIFHKDAGFKCTANTFQPYIAEISDELLLWQQSQSEPQLVALVKKIEKLIKILSEFEKNYDNPNASVIPASLTEENQPKH